MTYDVLTFGSITLDVFVTPQTPLETNENFIIPVGEKILLQKISQSCGGSSANASVGFLKFGMRTATFGFLGDDTVGHTIRHMLGREGVDTSHITISQKSESSLSVILNAQDGHRSVLNYKNPKEDFNPSHLFNAPSTRSLYIGHLTDKSDDFLLALPQWKTNNLKSLIGWNPGKTQFQYGFDHFKKVFPVIDVLILNKEESEYFTQQTAEKVSFKDLDESICGKNISINPPFIPEHVFDMRSIAQKFLDAGVGKVVITDSNRGAQLFDNDGNHFFVCAPDVPIESTLGAGDAFSVGILTSLLLEKPVDEQLLWGAWSSGFVIQKFGAQCGQASIGDIEEKIKR